MRVVFVSQWYEPEPGQLPALTQELVKRGTDVEVVTGFPNYPGGHVYPGYHVAPWTRQILNGVPLVRVALWPSHDNRPIQRIANYASFALSSAVLGPALVKPADVCYIYHPPATVGLAGVTFKHLHGAPFVYHIADMWPESVVESGMLGNGAARAIGNVVLGAYCKSIYRKAAAITVLSPGFKRMLIERGVPAERVHVVYNWCDDKVFRPVPRDEALAHELGFAGKLNFVYAGNFGRFQGLETLIRAAVRVKHVPEIQVVLIGTGVMEDSLKKLAGELQATNVRFIGRRDVNEMPKLNALSDVALVHLRNLPFFANTIPSKTQVCMASATPMLMAVAGDAADVVKRADSGVVVPPEDDEAMARAFLELHAMSPERRKQLGKNGHDFYYREMSIDVAAGRMTELFTSVARAHRLAPLPPAPLAERVVLRRLLGLIRQRQGTFLIGSLVTIAFNGLSIVLNGFGSILVARALGPIEWGLALWFITGTTTISMFADAVGVLNSNAYLIARGDGDTPLPTVRGTVLTYGAVLGVVVGLCFAVIPPLRHVAFRDFPTHPWWLLIFTNIIGLAIIAQIRGLFLGTKSFILLGALTLLKAGGFGVLAVVFVHVFKLRQAWHVGLAHVITTAWSVVAGVGYFWLRGLGRPRLAYLRACIRVGWRAASNNVMSFLHQRCDQYLVALFLGHRALGLYGVAVSLGELITQIPGMLGLVLFPLAALDKDKRAGSRRMLKRTGVMLAIVTAGMIPLWIAAPWTVRVLYGPDYAESIALLRLFIPAIVFMSGLLMVNPYINGTGYPRFQLLAMAFALAFNVALNLVLLPRLGVTGASVGSSISYGVWLALMMGYLVYVARGKPSADAATPSPASV